jgi:hypothetical protein
MAALEAEQRRSPSSDLLGGVLYRHPAPQGIVPATSPDAPDPKPNPPTAFPISILASALVPCTPIRAAAAGRKDGAIEEKEQVQTK